MATYCDYAPNDPVHASYHNTEYGFPTRDETVLMERLALEIFQAGLNWGLILKKREGINNAFNSFDVDTVSAYQAEDVQRLLADQRIIRNRLKVNAIIHNANVVLGFRSSHGGFAAWLDVQHPRSKKDWVKLFKKTFKFTGGEITGEFLMSTGYLPGAHDPGCPIASKIEVLEPPWRNVALAIYET